MKAPASMSASHTHFGFKFEERICVLRDNEYRNWSSHVVDRHNL